MSKELTKKSGIIYLSVFLLLICAISTAVMSFVASLTGKPIKDRQTALIHETLKQVLPPFVSSEEKAVPGKDAALYVAKNEKKQIAGYAVRAVSTKGYGGRVEALVGFERNGRIYKIVVTSHNETPGIGTKVMNRSQIRTISDVVTGKEAPAGLPKNRTLDSYCGKKLNDPLTRKNVHFVSGATVSSNAVLELVNTAREILKTNIPGVK